MAARKLTQLRWSSRPGNAYRVLRCALPTLPFRVSAKRRHDHHRRRSDASTNSPGTTVTVTATANSPYSFISGGFRPVPAIPRPLR